MSQTQLTILIIVGFPFVFGAFLGAGDAGAVGGGRGLFYSHVLRSSHSVGKQASPLVVAWISR